MTARLTPYAIITAAALFALLLLTLPAASQPQADGHTPARIEAAAGATGDVR